MSDEPLMCKAADALGLSTYWGQCNNGREIRKTRKEYNIPDNLQVDRESILVIRNRTESGKLSPVDRDAAKRSIAGNMGKLTHEGISVMAHSGRQEAFNALLRNFISYDVDLRISDVKLREETKSALTYMIKTTLPPRNAQLARNTIKELILPDAGALTETIGTYMLAAACLTKADEFYKECRVMLNCLSIHFGLEDVYSKSLR
ncbi:MAG: hypothetical protein NT030_02450 [Candidatus Saganbacteria bacterium]|nr:hypothetical protein [Candidatus Saganbacteria bacterium]